MVFPLFSAQPTSNLNISIESEFGSIEHLESLIVVFLDPGQGEVFLGLVEGGHQVYLRLTHLPNMLEEFLVNIDGLTASLVICGFDLLVEGTFVRPEGVDGAFAVSLGSAAAAKDLVDILHGQVTLFLELEQDMSI